MQSPNWNSKNLTKLALLTGLSLIMFLVESLFPPLLPFAPGAKLGLSNIFVLISLLMFNLPMTLIMIIAKCSIAILFTGNVMSLLYSLTGGIFSAVIMYGTMGLFFPKVSVIGISLLGGIAHNIAQLLVVSLVLESFHIFAYLPVLSFAGALAGIIVGTVVFYISKANIPEL